MFGGKYPLSKIGGQQLKDLPNELKKEYLDMYRPPGIIKTVETVIGAKSMIDDKIINTVPTTKLYRRGKGDERKDDKYEKTIGGMGTSLAAGIANLLAPEGKKDR